MRSFKLACFMFTVTFACLVSSPVLSADNNPWLDADSSTASRIFSTDDIENKNILTLNSRPLTVNLATLSAQLLQSNSFSFPIPLPDGSFANYQFSSSSVMAEELAEKYPLIRTFTATDLDNPDNTGRFDITLKGFHGMFKREGRWIFIDPERRDSGEHYLSYYADNAVPLAKRSMDEVLGGGSALQGQSQVSQRTVTSGNKTTYRIAVSASAEYVAFHGGTKAHGLAAIATMLNRVNGIFERDLAINFVLVAGNEDVIYTDSSTDPFNNNRLDAYLNPGVLSAAIGTANFDVGHVLNTGGGGLASLGVCNAANKAIGVTGTSSPTGDAFHIDYVAHELGHQLGANHTFNGFSSGCSGNRNAGTAWEPGSGSSIMGYAGLCGNQDVQANASAFFHIGTIEEILAFTSNAACGSQSALVNTAPEVNAGSDYVIPSNTPFKLSGSASDKDGDKLSYIWEQLDTGSVSNSLATMVDDGSRPLFRSWDFEEHGERYFPRLQDVLVTDSYTSTGEAYPNTNRSLTFRLTVRDGKGAVSTDEVSVTVVHRTDKFQVTAPQVGSTYAAGEELLIQWNVAGTNVAPVSCSTVEILMSKNAGISFDQVLVSGVANNGQYSHILSNDVSSDTRVMVRCLGNIFYAVNSGDSKAVSTSSGGGGSFSWLLIPLLLLAYRQRNLFR